MKRTLLLVVAILTMIFWGCASMTTIQTAETLDPGKMKYYVAWTPSHAAVLDTNSDGKADPMMFNTVEAGARVGVTERLDLGVKIFPIGLQFDGKYQFVKGEKIKTAADLGFGWMTITSGNSKTTLIDIIPTVPVTYRPFSWCALTVAPKMLMRISTLSNDSTDASSTGTYFQGGGTGALKFTIPKLGSMIFEYGKFGGKYEADHFALAIEKSFNFFGKNTSD